jgi:ABC-type phosphate transport system permease subunit
MFNKKIEENLKTRTITIGNTSFTFKEKTWLAAEKTFNILKNNKFHFRIITTCLALILGMWAIKYCQYFIYDFVLYLASLGPLLTGNPALDSSNIANIATSLYSFAIMVLFFTGTISQFVFKDIPQKIKENITIS